VSNENSLQYFKTMCEEYGGEFVEFPQETKCLFSHPSKALKLINELIEQGFRPDHPVAVVYDKLFPAPRGVGEEKLYAEFGKHGASVTVSTKMDMSSEWDVHMVLESLGYPDSEIEKMLVDLEKRFPEDIGKLMERDFPPELQELTSCGGKITEGGTFVMYCTTQIPENRFSKRLASDAMSEQRFAIRYNVYTVPRLLRKV